MGLGGLQHYTIEPSDLERTKDFYCEILGLENGDRPPLDFPGYWLYSGGTATVHLMGTRKPREGIVVRGTEKKYEDTGRLDHIAFEATDVDVWKYSEIFGGLWGWGGLHCTTITDDIVVIVEG